MPEADPKPNILIRLAAEGMIPVVGGCAGALAGGAEGGFAGVAVGQVVEKAINFFGARIVDQWRVWFRARPEAERIAALAELAALSPQQARENAEAALQDLKPDADRSMALEYLAAIPRTVERALVQERGQVSISVSLSLEEPQSLFLLLPTDIPPYEVPGPLPGTPYRLEQLLGSGGFGAVYRASAASLQHLPLAIKFCLDPSLIAALRLERDNLERLMKAGGEGWSRRIVRLYGYDLDYRTPFLVYEYVPGGDLLHHLTRLRMKLQRPLNADEVYAIIAQIAEALAFAHTHGLVHRDLKPANVLVDDGQLKLADFGLGGVMAARAQVSRIGSTTVSLLTAAEQASLFRGAGTPLYMSPEQRRGANPDPKHDLYSLGVIWYQLLVNDTAKELHAGWAKELAVRFQVPREQIDLIEVCVGWFEERPKNGAALLEQMKQAKPSLGPTHPLPQPAPLVEPVAEVQTEVRRSLFVAGLRRLARAQREVVLRERLPLWRIVLVSLVAAWFPGHLVGELIYWERYPKDGFFNIVRGTHDYPEAITGGIFAGLFSMAVLAVGQFWLWRRRRRQAVDDAKAIGRAVAADHSAALDAWGGPESLRTPESVDTLIHYVESSSASAPQDEARRQRFQQSLQASLLDGMSRAVRDAWRRPSWLRYFAAAVPLAIFLGTVFSEAVYVIVHPKIGFPNMLIGRGQVDIDPVVAGMAMGVTWLIGLVTAQYRAWRWRSSCLDAAADRYEQQLRTMFPEYTATAGLRDPDAVTMVARRAAAHTSLTRPLSPELREKLLFDLHELLVIEERKTR